MQSLNEESYRKKIKSLTGELEMFDAFADSFYQLCLQVPKAKQTAKQELTRIRSNLKDSVAYMRDICSDSSLGVPKGKRVQRQVRYERLKDEFLKLVHLMGTADASPQVEEQLEQLMVVERGEFQQKINLYKD